MHVAPRGGEAQGAGAQRHVHFTRHGGDFSFAGRAPPILAHHHAADGGMTDGKPHVQGDAPLELVEPFTESVPAEFERRLQRRDRHGFDAGEHAHHVVRA